MCAARDRDARALALSGLLFGCAFTIKQTAAFEAGAVFLGLSAAAPDWRVRARGLAVFGLGCALAPLGFALYFYAQGAFGDLWRGAVVAAGGRLGGDNVGFLEGLARLPGGLRPLLAPLICAALVMLRFRQWQGLPLAAPLRLILAWLIGGLLAIVAMRAMYDHYFLPLAPPLLLIAAVAVFHLLDFGSPQRARAAAALFGLAAIVAPVLFGYGALLSEGEDRAGVLAAGKAAVAAGLRTGDTALVVNRGLMFYVDTGAAPSGRLFHPQHLLCDFPLLQGDLLADALARRPRFVVLADVRMGMVCEKPERLRAAQGLLARDYQLVGHVAGDWDSFDIYRSLDGKAALDLRPAL